MSGEVPIPMLIWCPMCSARHIDEGRSEAEMSQPIDRWICAMCGWLNEQFLFHCVKCLHKRLER
jgi:hypothetical protein